MDGWVENLCGDNDDYCDVKNAVNF